MGPPTVPFCVRWGVLIVTREGEILEDDDGISWHAVDERSSWPDSDAVRCHIEFFLVKNPPTLCNVACFQIIGKFKLLTLLLKIV